MWPDCLRLGVAAITYDPLARTDLSLHPQFEPTELWKQLAPSQKVSLRRLAYEMQAGDVIYVKQGPKIIDRGLLRGGLAKAPINLTRDFELLSRMEHLGHIKCAWIGPAILQR